MKGSTSIAVTATDPLAVSKVTSRGSSASMGLPPASSKATSKSSSKMIANSNSSAVEHAGSKSGKSAGAESRRCRFASKSSSSSGRTKPGSLGPPGGSGLVNGQGLDPLNHGHGSNEAMINAQMDPAKTKGQYALSFDHAEYILSLVVQGKPTPSNFQIDIQPQDRPKGGSVFLVPKSRAHFDHYEWDEVMAEGGIATENGMSMDYRLFHIILDRNLSSSIFRREIFDMGNNSLVCYSGDDRILSAKQGMGAHDHGASRMDQSGSMGHHTPKLKKNGGIDLFDPHILDQSEELALRSQSEFNSWPRNRKTGGGGLGSGGSEMAYPLRLTHLRPSPFDSFSMWPGEEEDLLGSNHHHYKPPSNLAPSTVDCFQELMYVAEELACGKVVKNMTVFPSLQLTLLHPDMTKEFEKCCRLVCSDSELSRDRLSGNPGGIKLFYDTTFSLGRVYVTILTFVNCCYEGNPVMPLAVNLHEAKFKSSHQLFWARIVGDLPILQKYRFPLLIDDGEPAVHLAVRTQAPNLVQLEAWTHRFRDIDTYLRERGYGAEAIQYYKTCVNYLLRSKSKQAMHDRFRKEFEGVWPKDFVFYYRQKLLPRSGRLGQWALTKMKIDDEDFLTPYTNPQESFHSLCQHFSNWKRLTIDQMVRAFYFLFLYYVSETGNGEQGNGSFQIKRMYSKAQPDTRSKPKNGLVPHPSRIAEFIERNFPARRGQASPARANSSTSWLAAYDATELYATTRMKNSDLRDTRTQMENPCDMYDATALDSFLDEDLGLDMTDLRSSLLHPGFSNRDSVPSPAPNGRAPSPAPGEMGGNYNHLSTIPEAPSEQSLWRSSSEIVDGHHTRASSVINDIYPDDGNPFPIATSSSASIALVTSNAPHTLASGSVRYSSAQALPTMSNSESHMDPDYLAQPMPDAMVTTQSSLGSRGHPQAMSMPIRSETMTQAAQSFPPMMTVSSSSTGGGHISAPSVTTTTSAHSSNNPSHVVPSSLMLWKKVQHCVVFGGSFVTANKENTNRKLNEMNPKKN